MSAKSKTSLTARQRAETLRRVMQWVRPYGLSVGGSLAAAALSVAAQLYIPILCGRAIDQMFGPGQVDLPGVVRIALQVAFVAAAAALAQWLLSLFNNHIAFSVSRDLRNAAQQRLQVLPLSYLDGHPAGDILSLAQWLLSLFNNHIAFSVSRDLRNAAQQRLQVLPLSYLDGHPAGDILSRMVADVDTFADGLLMGFTQLFSGVLTILGTLLFMLRENVPITLVVVCITPLSLVVAAFLAKRSYGYFQTQTAVRGRQTALVNEMIDGQKVVQSFGREASALAEFDQVNEDLRSTSLNAIFFSSLTNPATRFVNNLVYAGVGLVGALYAVQGGISIGQLSVWHQHWTAERFSQLCQPIHQTLQRDLRCRNRAAERSGLCRPGLCAAGRCPTAPGGRRRSNIAAGWSCTAGQGQLPLSAGPSPD